MSETMRILIADDHYANRLLTQSLLQRHGHDIAYANNGRQAVKACEFEAFDLVLLDIQMPIMDGFEALRQIRAMSKTYRNTPIFALTAHCDASETSAILKSGFDAVLRKPFQIGEMMLQLGSKKAGKSSVLRHQYKLHIDSQLQIYDSVLALPLLEIQTLDILLTAIAWPRMKKILTIYWGESQALLGTLKNTRILVNSDPNEVLVGLRKTAHALKGLSANVGLLKASRLAALLQNAPIEHVPYLIEKLDMTLTESKTALQEYCKEANNPAAKTLKQRVV